MDLSESLNCMIVYSGSAASNIYNALAIHELNMVHVLLKRSKVLLSFQIYKPEYVVPLCNQNLGLAKFRRPIEYKQASTATHDASLAVFSSRKNLNFGTVAYFVVI